MSACSKVLCVLIELLVAFVVPYCIVSRTGVIQIVETSRIDDVQRVVVRIGVPIPGLRVPWSPTIQKWIRRHKPTVLRGVGTSRRSCRVQIRSRVLCR
jgi:hypothetical protein